MVKHFKKYGVIWILHIIVISLYFSFLKSISYLNVLFVLLFEVVFVVLFYYRNKINQDIIQVNGKKITIKGIFKNIELSKDDINKFVVKKNFISKIMDWSLITITTNARTYRIYTKETFDVDKMRNNL